MKLPTVKHKVKKGENLTKICKDRKFASGAWRKIYKAPYNKDFRKACPDPNVILPGAEFVVPILSKSQIRLLAEPVWVLIYALEDKQDLYKSLLKDMAKVKKQIARDEEARIEPIRKLTLEIIARDRNDRAELVKCQREAKKSLLGDFLGNCQKTYDIYERLNLDYWTRAVEAMGREHDIAKVKIKAVEASEKQVQDNIRALDRAVSSLQDTAFSIGKLADQSH